MVKYKIYSDLHIGSPYEILFPNKTKFTKNTILLGDNFEAKNTNIKNVKKLKIQKELAKKKIRATNGWYLDGNHELIPLKKNDWIIKNKTMFLHGDVIEWGFEEAKKWRMKKPGRTWFFLTLATLWEKTSLRRIKLWRKTYTKRAYELAKENNCKTIVMGHFHPKRRLHKKYKNIEVIFLPRGETILEL